LIFFSYWKIAVFEVTTEQLALPISKQRIQNIILAPKEAGYPDQSVRSFHHHRRAGGKLTFTHITTTFTSFLIYHSLDATELTEFRKRI
jgi:hypothetical protein